MRILGVDPGLNITGFGKIDFDAPGLAPRIVEAGVIRPRRTDSLEQRLATLFEGLSSIVSDADIVVVEALFSNYAHPRTAILMGHARGVILLAAARAGREVVSYTPLRVKKAVAGFGRAGKEQMQEAVRNRFNLSSVPKPPDVADALALALCHANVAGRM